MTMLFMDDDDDDNNNNNNNNNNTWACCQGIARVHTVHLTNARLPTLRPGQQTCDMLQNDIEYTL